MESISVIIPAYNAAKSIGTTINGVLRQEYAPAEIIVVDDGSTDDTASVVAAYAPAVKLISIVNRGCTGAKSVGVQASKSSWLAFCDADDLWHPDHLSRLVQLIGSHRVPFAFTNFMHVTDSVRAPMSHFEADPCGFWMRPGRCIGNGLYVADAPLFLNVLVHQAMFPSCTFVSRIFYDQIGGYRPFFGRTILEDFDTEFVLRCCLEGPTGVVVVPTVDINRNGQNMSADWILTLAGSIGALNYSLRNHELSQAHRAAVHKAIIMRSILGINCCFTQRRFENVPLFTRNLDDVGVPRKTAIKIAICKLPKPIAIFLSTALAASRNATRLVPRST